MSENKLNVIDLHKRYGEHEVLKGVSLQANAGDVISIIGSSGSGKSTFLRCINFLEKPSEGSIVVNGQTINLVRDKDGQLKVADKNQLRLLRTRLTMVFQHFNLWSHMTVLENVAFPLKMQGIGKTQRLKQAEAFLQQEPLLKSVPSPPASDCCPRAGPAAMPAPEGTSPKAPRKEPILLPGVSKARPVFHQSAKKPF